jgi:hypothetical protein
MKMQQYLTEAVDKEKLHDQLYKRFRKAYDKLPKARDTIMSVKDEIEKVQVKMRRHGIDELVNPQGNAMLNADEDFSVWDAMA